MRLQIACRLAATLVIGSPALFAAGACGDESPCVEEKGLVIAVVAQQTLCALASYDPMIQVDGQPITTLHQVSYVENHPDYPALIGYRWPAFVHAGAMGSVLFNGPGGQGTWVESETISFTAEPSTCQVVEVPVNCTVSTLP